MVDNAAHPVTIWQGTKSYPCQATRMPKGSAELKTACCENIFRGRPSLRTMKERYVDNCAFNGLLLAMLAFMRAHSRRISSFGQLRQALGLASGRHPGTQPLIPVIISRCCAVGSDTLAPVALVGLATTGSSDSGRADGGVWRWWGLLPVLVLYGSYSTACSFRC